LVGFHDATGVCDPRPSVLNKYNFCYMFNDNDPGCIALRVIDNH